MKAKFLGESKGYGLRKGYTYEIKWSKPLDEYTYKAHVVYCASTDEEMDKTIPLASEISIRRLFDITENIDHFLNEE